MTVEKWVKLDDFIPLQEKGRMLFRHEGKQILLIKQGENIFAVNNRCPHQGYPLSEGSLSEDCKLTCNWHNWKFDLLSGDTLVGGDKLRHYPVRFTGDELWIDIKDASQEEIRQKALDNLQASFYDYEYDRMARELSRYKKAGGRYQDAVADVIRRNANRFKYGMTHAFAAAADWMSLSERLEKQGRDEEALVAILEIVSHIAWDSLREKAYPFSPQSILYDETALLTAIENEDEDQAIALVCGAIAEGYNFSHLEPALARAALAHYNDFGHSAIYVFKAGQLIEYLGDKAMPQIIFSLVRHLIYASREDLIPEFRHYAKALTAWDGAGQAPVTAEDFKGLSIKKALDRMLQSSARIAESFAAIQQTLAWNLLHFDLARDQSTDHPIAQNVGWLTFSHGITFSNALRHLCGRYPDLWPNALLQLACFSGRNIAYIDGQQNLSPWRVEDAEVFFDKEFTALMDHGFPEPIVSCHRLKMLTAVEDEIFTIPSGQRRDILLQSLNRYLNSPLKRKHSLRTAKQAAQFVALEG